VESIECGLQTLTMKMRKLIISSLLIAGLFSSCQKNIDYFLPDPGQNGPDTTWYSSVSAAMPAYQLKNELITEKKKDSFQLSNTTIINTHSGLTLMLPSTALLTTQGNVATGRVYAETALLKTKGEMIRMGIPTVSNDRLLVTGGAFFLQLRNDTTALHIAQQSAMAVKFTTSTVAAGNAMKVFNGENNLPVSFNWVYNSDTTYNKVTAGADYYQVYTNQFNWINCARILDTTGIAQSNLAVHLPVNYTNANTVVWIAFNDMFSVITLRGDAATRRFVSGRIPANKNVTIIVMSKQGTDYFMAHEQVTTTAASSTITPQLVELVPVRSSLDNIRVYLNSL